jgi:transglutaminase-like putative cysteine protease
MNAQRFRVSHRTAYEYSLPMNDGYTLAVVMPRDTPLQTVEYVDVVVEPEPDERTERGDVFGNRVLQLGIHHQHDRLTVDATSDATVQQIVLDGSGPRWEDVAEMVGELRGSEALDVRPFAGGVPLVAGDHDVADLRALASPAFAPGRPIVDAARALCRAIHEQFDYDHAFTEVSTPLATVLAARRGVCQDFSHLAISALRMFGLPARYVSGYIESGSVENTTANASHAWCAVWVPGVGWIDFDPTNGHLPAESHVTVAWGRDYGDVAPVRGVVIGPPASQQLTVAVDVTRR